MLRPELGDVLVIASALLLVRGLYNRWEQEMLGVRPWTNAYRSSEDVEEYLAAYNEYLRESRKTAELLERMRRGDGPPDLHDEFAEQCAREEQAYAVYRRAGRRLVGEPSCGQETDQGTEERAQPAHTGTGARAHSSGRGAREQAESNA